MFSLGEKAVVCKDEGVVRPEIGQPRRAQPMEHLYCNI
jgi:hypothetical protein